MMSRARTFAKRGTTAALLAAALLAGCATNPTGLPAGTPRDQALAQLGRPTAVYPSPDGGERWQYSWQPMGDRVYNVDVGADGRVQTVAQTMTENHFARIGIGQWGPDELLREFGPPIEVTRVWSFDGSVWAWRYSIGPFHRLLYVYLDPTGVVRRWHGADDPAYESRDRLGR